MKHFAKSQFRIPLRGPDGRTIPFTESAAGVGILETDDEKLIAFLTEKAKARKGGIREISSAAYTEIKKKPLSTKSQPVSKNVISGDSVGLKVPKEALLPRGPAVVGPSVKPNTEKDKAEETPKAKGSPEPVLKNPAHIGKKPDDS